MSDVVRSRFTCIQATGSDCNLTAGTARSLIATCDKTWRFEQPGAKAAAEESLLRKYCENLYANLHDEQSPLSHTISAEAKERIEAKMCATLAHLKSPTADLDCKIVSKARAELESLVLQAQGPSSKNHRELGPFVAISVGNTATVSAFYKSNDIQIVRDRDDGDYCLRSYPATPDVIPYMPNPFTAPISPISAAQRLLEPTHTVDDAASRDFPTLFQSADPYEQQIQATKLFGRIFRRVLANVEAQKLGEVFDAVLVVPTSFSWNQRERLKRAATLIGLANVLTVNDAMASAVCHVGQEAWGGLAKQTVMVVHVGGHTMDAAILSGRNSVLKLRALAGFRNAAGEEFTNRLVRYCCEDFFQRTGYNLLESECGRCRLSLCRLRAACEDAKRHLSTHTSAMIEVEGLLYDLDYQFLLERSFFEELNADLFVKCLAAVAEANSLSRISKRAINHIVLEGGSAMIARLREMLGAYFEDRAIQLQSIHTCAPNERVLQVTSAQAQAIGAIRFQRFRLMEAKPTCILPVDTVTDYATIFTYKRG